MDSSDWVDPKTLLCPLLISLKKKFVTFALQQQDYNNKIKSSKKMN